MPVQLEAMVERGCRKVGARLCRVIADEDLVGWAVVGHDRLEHAGVQRSLVDLVQLLIHLQELTPVLTEEQLTRKRANNSAYKKRKRQRAKEGDSNTLGEAPVTL